jgi:hypothetical protein
MRHKVAIAALVLGVAATVGWLLVGQKAAGPIDAQAPPSADQAADSGTINTSPGTDLAAEAPGESTPAAIAAKEGAANSDPAMAETPETQQEAHVANRVVELQNLGMENDPASLDTILSELDNRDASIREAAVDAAVQFGSRDAIPRLMDAGARTDSPEEKSAILEAIEFLKLPTLTEALGQNNQPTPDGSSGASSNP